MAGQLHKQMMGEAVMQNTEGRSSREVDTRASQDLQSGIEGVGWNLNRHLSARRAGSHPRVHGYLNVAIGTYSVKIEACISAKITLNGTCGTPYGSPDPYIWAAAAFALVMEASMSSNTFAVPSSKIRPMRRLVTLPRCSGCSFMKCPILNSFV